MAILPEAYNYIGADQDPRIFLLCDHASPYIPPEYADLGLPEGSLETHIAYDLGAAEMTRALAAALGCPAILSNFSRLLIDPNRGLDDPTLVVKLSDRNVIPANQRVDKYQDRQEWQRRIDLFYQPYNDAIDAHLERVLAADIYPIILSVHSFTPVWRGDERPWHGAILWDNDPRLKDHMHDYFAKRPEIVFGDNIPYTGRLKGDCLYRHATRRGLAHGLIEIRQDIATDDAARQEWLAHLVAIMQTALKDPRMGQQVFYGSTTDRDFT
jgi:predicted N-formylglutamate amidohydrolase